MKKCEAGCTCGRHKRCEPGCTCKRHDRVFKKCEPGCTCGHHRPHTEEHRRKNSEGNRGRRRSADAVSRTVATRMSRGGYEHTPETVAAISRSKRQAFEEGRQISPWLVDGRSKHPLYARWYAMVRRCTNPADKGWCYYGARGIRVADEWLTPANFYRYADEVMGPCPPGHSIDRIDTDGNYEPGNVRWASASQQNSNRRPYTRSVRKKEGS